MLQGQQGKALYEEELPGHANMLNNIITTVPAREVPLLIEALKVRQASEQPLTRLCAHISATTVFSAYGRWLMCMRFCTVVDEYACIAHSRLWRL